MADQLEFPKCEECISYCRCVHQVLIRCDILDEFNLDTHEIYKHSEFWKKINRVLPNAGIILKE